MLSSSLQQPMTDEPASTSADLVALYSSTRVNGVLGITRAFGDIEYKLWKSTAWGQPFSADLAREE